MKIKFLLSPFGERIQVRGDVEYLLCLAHGFLQRRFGGFDFPSLMSGFILVGRVYFKERSA
jgi:hypothetical protein